MKLKDRAAQALRMLDPEIAHRLALQAAAKAPLGRAAPADPRLAGTLLGLDFPNPIGLAAGFDKNAEAPDGLLALGFGFVEVGTVTPLPQSGNPPPRLFRLSSDRALINRLGFNNLGHDSVGERLEDRARRPGIVGVNIGANRDSDDRVFDYVSGVRLFAPLASYLTVNISSPNTPGLRDLQLREALRPLLERITEAREAAASDTGRVTPLLLKIAPDVSDHDLGEMIETVMRFGVDGLVVANTSTGRPQLKNRRYAEEAGGLSGRPIFDLSTAMLARARQLAGPNLAIIGVGGVEDVGTAWSKIAAGADLVQLYTGMIYEGPTLPRRITEGLAKRLNDREFDSIRQARGIETARWAAAWVGRG